MKTVYEWAGRASGWAVGAMLVLALLMAPNRVWADSGTGWMDYLDPNSPNYNDNTATCIRTCQGCNGSGYGSLNDCGNDCVNTDGQSINQACAAQSPPCSQCNAGCQALNKPNCGLAGAKCNNLTGCKCKCDTNSFDPPGTPCVCL